METVTRAELARAVRDLRLAAGLRQADVARALHYGRSTYAYKEEGKTGFSLQDLLRLAALFGVEPELFLHPERYPGAQARRRVRRRKNG